ncbi:MAG TPA: hypothetical protein VFW27_26890 [Actinoplanes sp.]|jgi:hypothetical protein|nr:hypothetical protein [Actinoplanes sp.]
MILRLVVADGSQTPAVAESVEVAEDGAISGWRGVSAGGVGWFAGQLPAGELAQIRALVDAAGPAPAAMPPPDAAEEVLELAATGPVSIAGIGDGPGDWALLAAVARRLLDRLTDFPRAAVAVEPAPKLARLVHRGADPLRLDLGTVAVRATAWQGYYEPAGDWSGVIEGPGEIEAGPGWSYDIPVGLDADGVTYLAVDFVILSGPTRVSVRAKHEPAISPSADDVADLGA